MKVLGGLYIELIGLTHFATAAATVFYIYTEVKWSFIRPIDSHTLKTAPLKVHVFIFIHDVCCCFMLNKAEIFHSFLSSSLSFLSSFLCVVDLFIQETAFFCQTATMQTDTFFKTTVEHWRTHGNHVEPYSVQFFPALVQAALPTSGVHLECKGIHM